MAVTRSTIYSQVRYYKTLHFSRKRILYEMKRLLGNSWDKSKIAWIDDAIKGNKPKKPSDHEKVLRQVIALFKSPFALKKWGARWRCVVRATSAADLEKKRLVVKKYIEFRGFAFRGVRGDVGLWSLSFDYVKKRGQGIWATATVREMSRPRYILVEVGVKNDKDS